MRREFKSSQFESYREVTEFGNKYIDTVSIVSVLYSEYFNYPYLVFYYKDILENDK